MPLPKKENQAYQVPTPKDEGAHKITTATDAKAANTLPFATNTPAITLYSTTDIYYRLTEEQTEETAVGDIPTSSSWHFLPATQYRDVGIGADTKPTRRYIHTLAVSSAGTLYISESD